MDTKILKSAIVQALCENEYQDNTNYNDIADRAVMIYAEKWADGKINNVEFLPLSGEDLLRGEWKYYSNGEGTKDIQNSDYVIHTTYLTREEIEEKYNDNRNLTD
jgi:hypothetical protein